jgi:hypothetical protein
MKEAEQIMTSMIEVLKLALDALESCNRSDIKEVNEAITAIKKAIAELESQEPRNVRERWNVEFDGNDLLVCFNDHEKGDKCQYERYSPKRTWVGLTDVEIDYLLGSTAGENEETHISFARAIESKLKELNT